MGDTSTTTLYVDIDNESDDELVKILEDEDDRMDQILDDLMGIYRADKNNKDFNVTSSKGVYMDVSFEYFPMGSICKEDTGSEEEGSPHPSIDLLNEWCDQQLNYEEIESTTSNDILKQFEVEFADEKPFMDKIEEACDEVFQNTKHND